MSDPASSELLEILDEVERELGTARLSPSVVTACAERLESLTVGADGIYALVPVVRPHVAGRAARR